MIEHAPGIRNPVEAFTRQNDGEHTFQIISPVSEHIVVILLEFILGNPLLKENDKGAPPWKENVPGLRWSARTCSRYSAINRTYAWRFAEEKVCIMHSSLLLNTFPVFSYEQNTSRRFTIDGIRVRHFAFKKIRCRRSRCSTLIGCIFQTLYHFDIVRSWLSAVRSLTGHVPCVPPFHMSRH